jgi:hypothetical protein
VALLTIADGAAAADELRRTVEELHQRRTTAAALLPIADGAAAADELRRTVEELHQALAVRDAVIADLLRRMSELEQRVGVPAAPNQPPPPAAQPAPEPLAPTRPEPPVTAEAPPRAPAPGQLEVDEELIATALERALVQEGALVLPPGIMQVQPSLTYTRREQDAPVLRVLDGQAVAAEQEVRRDRLVSDLTLRLGLPLDTQLGLRVPYGYERTSTATRVGFAGVEETSRDAFGLGDLAVTVSKGLLRERGWRPDLVANMRWNSKTGQTDNGVRIGSGFHELTGTLTAARSQDPLVFVGSLSYTHAFEQGGVQPGGVVGLSVGTVLAASPETSLRFFLDYNLLGETEIDGQRVPGSDRVVGLFRIGASSILAPRLLVDVDLGIGLTEAAPEFTVNVAFPIRFTLPVRF